MMILREMPRTRSNRGSREAKALAELENLLWPHGPVCPHCGERERLYALDGVRGHNGEVRPGLRKCGACRRQFTVRTGSMLARSHVAPSKWLEALRLAARDGDTLNPHRLHRLLGVTYRTAVLLKERLALGMADGSLAVRPAARVLRPVAAASPIMVFGSVTFGGNEILAADNVVWRWAAMRDQAADAIWVV